MSTLTFSEFPAEELPFLEKVYSAVFGPLLVEEDELDPTRFLSSVELVRHRSVATGVQQARFTFKWGLALTAYREQGGEQWRLEEACRRCGSGTRRALRKGEPVLECGGCGAVVAPSPTFDTFAGVASHGLGAAEAHSLQVELTGRLGDFGVDPLEAILASTDFFIGYEKLLLACNDATYWAQARHLPRLLRLLQR